MSEAPRMYYSERTRYQRWGKRRQGLHLRVRRWYDATWSAEGQATSLTPLAMLLWRTYRRTWDL